jgi:hypothetical protein
MGALAVLLIGATAYTQPPQPLSGGGTFEDILVTVVSTRQAGPNTISEQLLTVTATGTLDGAATSLIICVTDPTGKGVCHATTTFAGSVDGHEGTLEIQDEFRVNGTVVEAAYFTIVSGTGELATLHGHGSFTGDLSPGGVGGSYTMEYFFAP